MKIYFYVICQNNFCNFVAGTITLFNITTVISTEHRTKWDGNGEILFEKKLNKENDFKNDFSDGGFLDYARNDEY